MLRKLSNPGWFQALGCVLGYDWHSSGVTTADVTNPSASVKVYYTNTKWAIFKDQILTGSFSSAGDSGSAVDKNNQFVGLLYAGSSTISVTCKAQYILGPLRITV